MSNDKILTVKKAADKVRVLEKHIREALDEGMPYIEEQGEKRIKLTVLYVWMSKNHKKYAHDMTERLYQDQQDLIDRFDPAKDELLDVKQVAAYLMCSEAVARKMLRDDHRYPYVKRGNRYFVWKSDLLRNQ
jgi:hypothetical protein